MKISESKPNYIRHFKNFIKWCEEKGLSPQSEDSIMSHLKDYKSNDGGKPRASGTIRNRVMAIIHNLDFNQIKIDSKKIKELSTNL